MTDELTAELRTMALDGDVVLCVELQGNFVWSNNVEIDTLVLERLEETMRGVILDFSGVGIIDSRGLGTLTTLSIKILKKRMGLVLVGVNSRIEDMLRAFCLSGVFVMKETQQEALEYLQTNSQRS